MEPTQVATMIDSDSTQTSSTQPISALSDRELVNRAMAGDKDALSTLLQRYQLTEERAFAFLARVSQTRNVKLRAVAEELVAEAEQRADS